jgi:short subunit dehydrogenase-like uncharacterized protein
MHKPVVVYGASGYTGRLICEYLRQYNVPFIAAGRNAGKVKAAMEAHVPGIETADYEIAEVGHDVGALTALLETRRDLRGVSSVADHLDDAVRWSA